MLPLIWYVLVRQLLYYPLIIYKRDTNNIPAVAATATARNFFLQRRRLLSAQQLKVETMKTNPNLMGCGQETASSQHWSASIIGRCSHSKSIHYSIQGDYNDLNQNKTFRLKPGRFTKLGVDQSISNARDKKRNAHNY